MRVNYRQIPTMLMSESPFEGNSMRAMIPVGGDKDGDYISHRGRLYSSRSAQELFKERASVTLCSRTEHRLLESPIPVKGSLLRTSFLRQLPDTRIWCGHG